MDIITKTVDGIPLKASVSGIDAAGIYKSVCPAYIEYWDGDGRVCSSQVSDGNGWNVSFKEDVSWIWRVSNAHTGIHFSVVADIYGGDSCILFSVKMPCDSLEEKGSCILKSLQLMPGLSSAIEGDGSELVIPVDNGVICKAKKKINAVYKMPLFAPFSYKPLCNMPLFAIIRGKSKGEKTALVSVIEGGTFDASLLLKTNWDGVYSIDAVFAVRDYRDEPASPEDIGFSCKLLSGGEAAWDGVGRYYRRYNREVKKLPTLKEKMKGNPTLEYAAKALCLRCRMGVKTVPPEILEQTPDNLPPLKVYMTFENVREIIRELKTQGVGPVEICLVGWNYTGHDGAFPQLFPVEEKFGGEAGLMETIRYSHESGYPLSLYDNYHDAYSLADTFDMENIALQHDGSRAKGSQYAGGQVYLLCGRRAYEEYALKSLRQTSALGIKGTYYIDEITLLSPRKCYDPKHPMTRRDNIMWWKKIMGEAQKLFGSSHSEGGRDWALPETDRVYCLAARPDFQTAYVDEHVPLYQVAYHGRIIYNTFRSAVNTFPGDDTYLINLSYGSLPIVYYHHLFNPNWNASDGLAYDMPYGGEEKTKTDAAVMKRMTDDIAKTAHLATEDIEGYVRHSAGLTETIFSNGESIYANFSDVPCDIGFNGKRVTVPAHDFVVAEKGCRK
ncbi:MAG: DUF5696 domain-containing protein [Eubacteriales bacterium]|nr:DUF5696 domain-containing protein [Eubacteriales bacterium]